MEKTVCVNAAAGCTSEGGVFHWTSKGFVCEHCWHGAPVRDGSHRIWPMTLNHVAPPTEGPITVNNLRELRRVERQYGVNSHVFNNDRPETR